MEARADVMVSPHLVRKGLYLISICISQVRAAQSLTLLSHSLKLSLLLSQEPIETAATQDGSESQTLDEEAIELIKSTAREKERCAKILEEMFGLGRKDEKNNAEDIQNTGQSTEEAVKVEKPPGSSLDEEEDLEMEPVE